MWNAYPMMPSTPVAYMRILSALFDENVANLCINSTGFESSTDGTSILLQSYASNMPYTNHGPTYLTVNTLHHDF